MTAKIQTRSDAIERLHSGCENLIQLLKELQAIHVEIDKPDRVVGESDESHALRLRKVLFHVRAVTYWTVSADVLHVMAPEIRTANRQLRPLVDAFHDGVGANRKDTINQGFRQLQNDLSPFIHPTPIVLTFGTHLGGLGKSDEIGCLTNLFTQIAGLANNYTIGLITIAEVLGSTRLDDLRDVICRVTNEITALPPAELLEFVEPVE